MNDEVFGIMLDGWSMWIGINITYLYLWKRRGGGDKTRRWKYECGELGLGFDILMAKAQVGCSVFVSFSISSFFSIKAQNQEYK